MSASPAYEKSGFLRTDSADDRCAHYIPKESILNLHRCVCCVYYDANALRCLNYENRIDIASKKGGA